MGEVGQAQTVQGDDGDAVALLLHPIMLSVTLGDAGPLLLRHALDHRHGQGERARGVPQSLAPQRDMGRAGGEGRLQPGKGAGQWLESQHPAAWQRCEGKRESAIMRAHIQQQAWAVQRAVKAQFVHGRYSCLSR